MTRAHYRELERKLEQARRLAMEPTDQPYGLRELGIRDVNGVGIVFAQDIDHDQR